MFGAPSYLPGPGCAPRDTVCFLPRLFALDPLRPAPRHARQLVQHGGVDAPAVCLGQGSASFRINHLSLHGREDTGRRGVHSIAKGRAI